MTARQGVPRFDYTTARDAAYKLLDAARSARAEELHPLPFNRYDPDDTYWWLSPSTENPAYRFGKIGVTARDIVPAGQLFVGLVVEKGIGQSAAPMFEDTARGRRWIMVMCHLSCAIIRRMRSNSTDVLGEAQPTLGAKG